MTTSLSQQLQRLALPQTAQLIDSSKRVSILFDAKEAANKDRRTIFELGSDGLQQLISINPQFQQFENTLFDEYTLNVERSVEDREVNQLLNRNIKKFLQHLSPYFLLRPAHMCLEWLLRRFHVHNYNRAELMALALPYHETNIFVRVIQTFDLNKRDDAWGWLRPLQKPGLPLPKGTIINRASADASFFKFICQSSLSAIKEFGSEAAQLQVQINFYTSVVVGAFEVTSVVTEWQITTVLESLLYALQCNACIDVVAAGYVVTAQLVARTQLKSKLCNALVERITAVPFHQLLPAAVMDLILIFDRQTAAPPNLSKSALKNLLQQKWLINVLANLSKENIDIYPLCGAILRYAVKAIATEEECSDAVDYKRWLMQFLNDVELSETTARKLINCFLDAYITPQTEPTTPMKHGDVIELDESDDEDVAMDSEHLNFKAWYSEYLSSLERKYPTSFDATIKEALGKKNNENKHRSAAVKMALGFRLKFSNQNQSEIYEGLYHYTSKMRLAAVQTLMANLNDYQNRVQNYQLLKECLADRLMDESVAVQSQLLKLSTKDFIEILGYERFAKCLIEIFYRIRKNEKTASHRIEVLEQQLVEHLTAKPLIDQYDSNIILMAVMPLLFPSNEQDPMTAINHEAVQALLQSSLCEKIVFLKNLRKVLLKNGNIKNGVSIAEMRKVFLNAITNSNETIKITDLIKSIDQQDSENYFQQEMQLTNLLILGTAFCLDELTVNECWHVFQRLQKFCQPFTIRIMLDQAKDDWLAAIPLQLYTDFLLAIVKHTKFNMDSALNWQLAYNGNDNGDDDNETRVTLRCLLSVFESIASEAFSPKHKADESMAWTVALKEFFNAVFKTPQNKIEFLLNFYTNSESDFEMTNYTVLRLYAFKVLKAILSNTSNDYELNMVHILKISIGLIDKSQTLRVETLATLEAISGVERLESNLLAFVKSILARNNELSMDDQQYPLILYTILVPKTKKTQKQLMRTKVLNGITSLLKHPDVALKNSILTLQLLRITKHINDANMLTELMPLAVEALEYSKHSLLPKPYSQIFRLIYERFTPENIVILLQRQREAWSLFEMIFQKHNIFLIDSQEAKLQPLPCLAMEIFNEYIYEKLPASHKTKFIELMLKAIADSDNNSIFLTANRLLKRCEIDCEPLIAVIEKMYQDAEEPKQNASKAINKKLKSTSPSLYSQLNTVLWKQGVALLELLEDKKQLLNLEKMLTALFDLLAFCLLDADANATVEYTKQLALSILLNCCQHFKARQDIDAQLKKTLSKSTFRIDQIVQCLRATPNPQTHRRALICLAQCAELFPQQVLHNVVDIFTFMGSSVVRHDDAYSFHIIDNIIQSIIPILVQQGQHGATDEMSDTTEVSQVVIPVLKVFSDILLDVPEHRRFILYTKLMQTLGADAYLWRFLCILFESHVMHEEKFKSAQRKMKKALPNDANASNANHPRRLDVALALMDAFEPQTTLETCIQFLTYLKSLPISKDEVSNEATKTPKKPATKRLKTSDTETTETCLFDVQNHSDKQLRHYKYVIMQFLTSASSAPEFLRKLACLSDEQHQTLKPHFQNLIIQILSYLAVVNATIEQVNDEVERKFLKIILNYLQDALDNALALLSPEMFIAVVNGLMQHQLLSIRRKVIELLSARIQKEGTEISEVCKDDSLEQLIDSLSSIIGTVLDEDAQATTATSSHERVLVQQCALIATKHLSKYFALKYVDKFKALLKNITKIAKARSRLPKILLASVMLAIVEVSCNLKAHSLVHLPKFMPCLIDVLQQQVEVVQQQPPDHVCIAIITGMQKLFDSLPLFLGPYAVDVITAFSSMATRIYQHQSNDKHQNTIVALQKIDAIWQKIATSVPVRILVPSCEKAYRKLLTGQQYVDIGILMNLLKDSVKHANSADLNAERAELSNFCLYALEFRLGLRNSSDIALEAIDTVELSIAEAFVAWILKLSESAFRPLYEKIYEWAFKTNSHKETQLTFFVFSKKASDELKTIFALFSSIFIESAANLLKQCNSLAKENNNEDDADEQMEIDSECLDAKLIKEILGVLHNIFLHASKFFISMRRFELLMPSVVDQLENRLVLEDDVLQSILIDCISQFAVAVSTDVMWKQLNYQVLMKTRSNIPEVRMLAMNSCVEIARKLGDEFSTLLPETVPFIAELFEDENSRVEKNTRKAVQELESILGESLQKYL